MKFTHSISFRLIIAVLAVVVLVVCASGIYDYTSQSQRLEQRLDSQLKLLESRLQLNLPGAMWNFEEQQIQRILDAEQKSDSVARLELYNDSGELTAKSPGSQTDDQRQIRLHYQDGEEKIPLGKVVLFVDYTTIDETLSSLALSTIVKGIILAILLLLALYFLVERIVLSPLSEVANALENISRGEGDLTQRLSVTKDDEIGKVALSFNEFVEKIQSLVLAIQDSVSEAVSNAQSVQSGTVTGRSHIEKQQSETDQVAAAITEMSSASKEIAQNVQNTADSADQVSKDAQRVSEIIENSVSSINGLSEQLNQATEVVASLENDVEGIVSVLEVIGSIAEQTNLLALNAAIEAARAGEQGRGFAVVADEVRALASRTQESTAQIQSTIDKLQSSAKSAVNVMEQSQKQSQESVEHASSSSESISGILDSTHEITGMASQIATAVEQQSTVAEELSHNVNRIVSAGQDSMNQLESMTDSAESMRKTAEKLAQLANQFKA
ncbi:Methyl-accepting chemotaxis protein PctB [Saliniradius amylolyticus]|uniref:Methyl-accepting chemotaxis protein PctB n=1 Tax=Saliniradius amylolyticus TaxID=2183582 RepID=A0A2S2E610_9ALTE|nr:methyl-accepting chemotaxis protein [Saliniradius amylolyticus]AWL13088.1 Methyl-accepting chemotaxis protein PctB [Saliniradius amylolyticus]